MDMIGLSSGLQVGARSAARSPLGSLAAFSLKNTNLAPVNDCIRDRADNTRSKLLVASAEGALFRASGVQHYVVISINIQRHATGKHEQPGDSSAAGWTYQD